MQQHRKPKPFNSGRNVWVDGDPEHIKRDAKGSFMPGNGRPRTHGYVSLTGYDRLTTSQAEAILWAVHLAIQASEESGEELGSHREKPGRFRNELLAGCAKLQAALEVKVERIRKNLKANGNGSK